MFPSDFIFGVASSSFQSEGALHEDGRGLSIWDDCEPHIKDKSKLMPGVDGYHHVDEDIALLKELGVKAYRFSISWTRILPNGIGPINQKGVDFYVNLVKKLRENGIEPYVTLFHWDYPKALEDNGGWLSENTITWFRYYVMNVAKMFDGLVSNYIMINEPQCSVYLGYMEGSKAPWKRLPVKDVLRIGHNIMKASAEGAALLRSLSSIPLNIGVAETFTSAYPYTDSPEDVMAARRDNDEYTGSLFNLPYWGDPSFLGEYPKEWVDGFNAGSFNGKECYGDYDFFALNLYGGYPVRMKDGKPERVERPNVKRNSLGWAIEPKAMGFGLKEVYRKYHKPIFISENGICLDDKLVNGSIHDPLREEYIHSYLDEVEKAMQEGALVKGYFYWSFLDNLEWEEGFKPRFGLVYTDYPNGAARIKKDSFYYYQSVIKNKKL